MRTRAFQFFLALWLATGSLIGDVRSAGFSPIVSEASRANWPKTPADWVTWRAARKAMVFPSGIPTDESDSITDDWATNYDPGLVPVGAQKVLVLHDATPGGRTGGSEQHCDLCVPSATPIGRLAVYLHGHTGDSGLGTGWDYQNNRLRASGYAPPGLIEPLLARGWHVMVVDLPNNGEQPTPQMIRVNGTVVNLAGHNFSALDSDGGPPSTQMFVKHTIRAITTALRISGATEPVIIGHSGGANTAAMLAAMDDRARLVYILQGGTCVGCDWYTDGDFGNAAAYDSEGDRRGNPYYHTLARYSFGASVMAAAALAGRRTIWAVGADDIVNIPLNLPVNQPAWNAFVEFANAVIKSSGGVIVPYIQPIGEGHGPGPTECAFVLADIEAHL